MNDSTDRLANQLIDRFNKYIDRYQQTGDPKYLAIAHKADAMYLRLTHA